MNATGSAETPSPEANSQSASNARPWLKSYPAAVPPKIDEARIGTLVDFFRHARRAYANRPAVESFGKRMTYGELGREAAESDVMAAEPQASERATGSPSCCRTSWPIRRSCTACSMRARRWSTSTRSTRRASSSSRCAIPARACSSCSRTSHATVGSSGRRSQGRPGRHREARRSARPQGRTSSIWFRAT